MKQNIFKKLFFTISALLLFSCISIAQNFDLPITTVSNDAKNLFKEGRAYLENIHTAKAVSLFDKALKLDNDFALAHMYRAWTNIGGTKTINNHIDKAVSLADNVTGGEKNLILYSKAIFNNDNTKAKMYLNNLIVAFPYNKRIQHFAGLDFYRNQDYKTALKHFKKSEKIDENYAPNYNMIGYCEVALNNFDEAEKAFKKYIQLLPDQPNPYDSYAELLQKRGKFDESIIQYQKAFDIDNTFTGALIGIGNNYILKGDFNKARDTYDRCYKLASNTNQKLRALYWKGISYVHQGDVNSAIKIMEKRKNLANKKGMIETVIGNINTEGIILTEMGQVKKGLKKFKLAEKMIKKSNLPDEIKTGLNLNERLNICYALAADNKLADADKELMICREQIENRNKPNEIKNLHNTVALIEMKKGNYQTAIENFNKTDLDVSPYSMQQVAIAYEKLGNTKMANEFHNKVRNNNSNGLGFALIRKSISE